MAKIALLTSGGDAPGMNACIRAIVRKALVEGYEIYAIHDGYKGLYENKMESVTRNFVSEIIYRGGTILGTARLANFNEPKIQEVAANNLKAKGIENLIVIGGDGSFKGALDLAKFGIKTIGIPGTIDNDVACSDVTIGFDTALNTIVEAIDRLRDTSSSHQRCSIVEVMGRNCGDLAINAGLASGAELVLSSERVMTKEEIINELIEAKEEGKKHEIVVVSENQFNTNELAAEIEAKVGMETRATILGHLQRGGKPTAKDRVLASLMGAKAIDAVKSSYDACCICSVNNDIVIKDLKKALEEIRMPNLSLYSEAERLK